MFELFAFLNTIPVGWACISFTCRKQYYS